MDGVAVVTVFTGGTHFLAVFAEEPFGAKLVAARPVPASVAGDAAALCHLAGLLALAVAAPAVNNNKRIPFIGITKSFLREQRAALVLTDGEDGPALH